MNDMRRLKWIILLTSTKKKNDSDKNEKKIERKKERKKKERKRVCLLLGRTGSLLCV
jgi:hypothetical protein